MSEGFSGDARPLRNAAVPAGSGGEVLAPDLYLPTGAVRFRHAYRFSGTRKTRSQGSRITNFRFFASHGSRRCWSTCEVRALQEASRVVPSIPEGRTTASRRSNGVPPALVQRTGRDVGSRAEP